MPSSLIDLDDGGASFLVRWGDFLTLVAGEWTNSERLELSVLATVGASKGPDTPTSPFAGAVDYPDEAQWFHQAQLPVAGEAVAALVATDFSWTPRAAAVRDEYRVSSTTVSQIRAVAERLHRDRVDGFRTMQQLLRHGVTDAVRELVKRAQEPATPPPDAVHWCDGRAESGVAPVRSEHNR